jgi:replicative DNA helicase
MANVSRIPMDKDHVSKLSPEEMVIPIKAASEIAKLPIFIRDDLYDLTAIVAVAKQFKQKRNIGLFIVDYAQLIRAPDTKEGNREQKVAEVSRVLRLLAMALDTPVIVLCQLNQWGFTRESRSLEQDATAMWMIEEEEEGEPNIRKILIPWQRNGPSGVGFKVTFLGNIARMENYASDI